MAMQKAIGQLFDVDRSVVTKHLKNIYESGELSEESTCANFAQVADNGKTYQYKFYSLSAIIAVGLPNWMRSCNLTMQKSCKTREKSQPQSQKPLQRANLNNIGSFKTVSIYKFGQNDFFRTTMDTIDTMHPFHLVSRF